MKTLLLKIFVIFIFVLFISFSLMLSEVSAGKNDVPSGAGETVINVEPKKAIWWEGSLNNDGDIDWYLFNLEKPSTVLIAFEKPADKEFYCSLYSEDNTEEAILEVKVGNAGEEFAGYTVVKLEPGKYYLKIWGAPGDFTEGKDDTYKYALEYPRPGKGPGSGGEGEEKEQEVLKEVEAGGEGDQEMHKEAPEELSEEQAARLLDAHDEEERMRREMKRMMAPAIDTEVEKDW